MTNDQAKRAAEEWASKTRCLTPDNSAWTRDDKQWHRLVAAFLAGCTYQRARDEQDCATKHIAITSEARLAEHEQKNREWRKLSAERDRYRTALEKIHFMRSELGEIPGEHVPDPDAIAMQMANTAYEALNAEK